MFLSRHNSGHIFTSFKSNNYQNCLMFKMSLTTKIYIDIRMCLMVDFLLCGDTAIAVSFFHSSIDGDVEAISCFRDMWLPRRNDLILTVLPLHRRFGVSILNITLKQRPVTCMITICNIRLLSCTCESITDRLCKNNSS